MGFDLFDQVQIATGVSEIGREIVGSGGGELTIWVSPDRPQRLVIRATGVDCGDDLAVDRSAGLAAARRLLGPPIDQDGGQRGCTFSRLLPKTTGSLDVRRALTGGAVDPYHELQRQDTELLRILEQLRARESELESLNAELEETNRGVLALYAELDDKAESVRRASDERSRFLSNVTHELRTPLSSIAALCRLVLTNDEVPLAAEQVRQIGYIQKSVQDLLDFVSDLLDLAKVEAGKVAVRSVPFEVEEVFAALRGMFRPLSSEASFPIIFEAAHVPTMVSDENKVSQILRNLISNALKFTERGEIRVTAQLDATSDEIVMTVADTGVGIAADDLNRIFDEFVQVDMRRGRRERSSGLGLPLSRHLAELMGGSLKVESHIGVGSTFTFRLPREYPREVDAPASSTKDGYVLVVDDDQISRYVAKEQLERHGWRVIEAADGEMALKLAREGGCRAIVSDLAMPGMSGFELLDRLNEDPSTAGIPVVIRTSLPLGDVAGSLARAAAIFSKDVDSIQAVVDRVTTTIGIPSSEPRQ
ncbi:MAG: hybrid sensor histidine kinase/response regulator [Candidatus Dormibacteraeota bacterium]|nr:hybrid sensor histidine kinase/response regulator [Candidatus Dormibacteraeota bacterium]